MPGKLLFCGALSLVAVACAVKPVATSKDPPSRVAPVPAVSSRASGFKPEAKDLMPRTDPAESMRQLRMRALSWSAQDLGLVPSPEAPRVYGVVMDWPLGKATATVTSFATGDASLYTSTGFGVIGGVAHERVRDAAGRFVSVAERYYDAAIPTKEFPLPLHGRVRFIMLGYKGRRAIEGSIPSPSGNGTVHDLFNAGQAVLTELRRITPGA